MCIGGPKILQAEAVRCTLAGSSPSCGLKGLTTPLISLSTSVPTDAYHSLVFAVLHIARSPWTRDDPFTFNSCKSEIFQLPSLQYGRQDRYPPCAQYPRKRCGARDMCSTGTNQHFSTRSYTGVKHPDSHATVPSRG